MTVKLKAAIAGYFAADRDRDAASMSRHFAEHAVVQDEGQLHTGREAIQSWMSQSWKKYDATTEPFAVDEGALTTIVTSHVAGNFPGSPIDLRFHFVLEDDLIAKLEVTS